MDPDAQGQLAAFRAQWTAELETGVPRPSPELREQVARGSVSRDQVRRNARRARAEWDRLWAGPERHPPGLSVPSQAAVRWVRLEPDHPWFAAAVAGQVGQLRALAEAQGEYLLGATVALGWREVRLADRKAQVEARLRVLGASQVHVRAGVSECREADVVPAGFQLCWGGETALVLAIRNGRHAAAEWLVAEGRARQAGAFTALAAAAAVAKLLPVAVDPEEHPALFDQQRSRVDTLSQFVSLLLRHGASAEVLMGRWTQRMIKGGLRSGGHETHAPLTTDLDIYVPPDRLAKLVESWRAKIPAYAVIDRALKEERFEETIAALSSPSAPKHDSRGPLLATVLGVLVSERVGPLLGRDGPGAKLQAMLRSAGGSGRITVFWSRPTHGLCGLEARRCVITLLAVAARWNSRRHHVESVEQRSVGAECLGLPMDLVGWILGMLRRTDLGGVG